MLRLHARADLEDDNDAQKQIDYEHLGKRLDRLDDKRVERIWRREGLKVPQRQPKRCRLWLNDGSCIRLRPEYPGHVWAYDFVEERIHDGRKFRILTIIDEASRECLALVVSRQLRHEDVLAALAELFIERGPPAHIRSDNVLCREAAAGFCQQISMRRQPSARHAF